MKDYPEVEIFAEIMQFQLRKNAHKDGWPTFTDRGRSWKDCPIEFLQNKLMEEVDELLTEITAGNDLDAIRHEAADVANIAMMLADNAGALYDDISL